MHKALRIALVSMFAVASMSAQDRSAAQILAEFDRLQFPSNSAGTTPEAFRLEVRSVASKKGELALELYRTHPDHARVGKLLGDRWTLAINSLEEPARVLREATAQLQVKGLRADVRREALLARARATLATGAKAMPCMDAIEAFLAVDGEAVAGGFLIMELLRTRNIPNDIAKGLVATVQKVWPKDRWLGPDARGYKAQMDRVGKPMALAFEDLLSGDATSTTDGSSAYTLCVYWDSQVPKCLSLIHI